MLIAERRQKILEYIEKNGKAAILPQWKKKG